MTKKLSKGAKKLIINISVVVGLTAITLLVLFLSYRNELNLEEIGGFLRGSNAWLIVAAFGCMILTVVCEALSIFVISRRLGEKTKFRRSLAYASADVYYSAITPSSTGGQPASMFYMVRDGMSAANSGFTLVFNVMAFASSILITGIFSFTARPEFLSDFNGYTLALIIFGFAAQVLLLGFALMCMLWSKAILKVGNAGITLLQKMRIMKKPEKWRAKLAAGVEKYGANREVIKKHPFLFSAALFFNLAERVAYNMITCLVCYAAAPDGASLIDLFAMQTFVLLGFSAIPLPGGVGAFEFMYINVFGTCYDSNAFIMSAMMTSRVITFYCRMIICGIFTLAYHMIGVKNKRIKPDETADDFEPPPVHADEATGLAGAETLEKSVADDNAPETSQATGSG